MAKLRSVRVTYVNGEVIETNMASHLTDDDIHSYFSKNRVFNIGSSKDRITRVKSVKILD